MNGTTNRTVMLRIAIATVIAAVAFAVTGCTEAKQTSPGAKAKTATTVPASTAKPASSMTSDADMPMPDSSKQMCASCSDKKKPVPTTGEVESLNGKQVINVSIKNGTYLPNRFVAEAGKPITVVFTVEGKPAMGCVSKPTFSGDKLNREALSKSLSITSGTKSVDLGALDPGTYEFACSMGMNVGQIVVQ